MIELGMALKLKGLAMPDAIAHMTGMDEAAITSALEEMVADGRAGETPRGHRLTPEGVTWITGLLDEERAGVDHDTIEDIYERFCEFNGDFKQLVTDWQVKDVDGEQVLNDHTDADYDAAIVSRLAEMDAVAQPVFGEAAALVPRLARYQDRFTAALGSVQAGEHGFISSPLKDSYHNVWFELHEELILLCGRTRAEEAAAGRGA